MVRREARASVRPAKQERDASAPTISTSVSLHEVALAGGRLEASAFAIEARRAVDELRAGPHPVVPLYGSTGLCSEAHNAFRFRRVYVTPQHGVPFLSSSDIIAMRPAVTNFLSRKLTKRLDQLLVRRWDVLISCSGTVGNVALAGTSLADMALSQDAIRLRAPDANTAGFIAAFLRSQYGRLQLLRASYGSVIVHIEPEHLATVLIPNVPAIRRIAIGREMCAATELRDHANSLLVEADCLLHERLELPPLDTVVPSTSGPLARGVRLSQLADRLEAHYHSTRAAAALNHVHRSAATVLSLGSPEVAREIRAITKFRRRVYVPHGGIPLLSSKQIFQVDPVDVKGLARGAHTKDLPEIELKEGMVLVTVSGTIGRVQIIPRYMQGWTANQHASRIVAADTMNPGYLYTWLASDYGTCLTTRQAYGSVILELDKGMLSSVPVPMPDRAVRDEIGDLVLRANSLRDDAWRKEHAAISQLEEHIRAPVE